MTSETATTTGKRNGAELGKRIGLIVAAAIVTFLIVLFILNLHRPVTIDLLFGDLKTRVVWALLVPFGLGIILGFIGGRFKIRS